MTLDEFWRIVDESRSRATDCEAQAGHLVTLLARLPPDEIADFDRLFGERRVEAYRWDLWGVAYIVNGGCSDDGFEYFRCWLVSRGRAYYEHALASPEDAASGIEPGEEPECEDILYAADRAYTQATGRELPPTPITYPSQPAGRRWSEDDVFELFPRVAARFA